MINETAASRRHLIDVGPHNQRLIIFFYMSALVLTGVFWPGGNLLPGWVRIQTSPGVLITDYFSLAGPGPAFLNAGLVGLLGLGLLTVARTEISGGAIAAVFTMAGFAFFGKTPFSSLPIFLGVYLFSLARRGRFQSYVLVAMFGTSLGPLVNQVAFGIGGGPFWGAVAGVMAGFVLPALAPHLLHNHQGFNLYNVGFTAGIVGTFALAVLRSFGHGSSPVLMWSTEYTLPLSVFFALYFLSMALLGLLGGASGGSYRQVLSLPGGMITDFATQVDYPSTYLNMGLMGLLGMAYPLLVGGTLNGPLLGGVLTMVGFGAFGKHLRNAAPIMGGVYLGTLIQVSSAHEPGPLLAALFGTCLAPLAGSFGVPMGLGAGALHLAVVSHVGVMHGGMNLYNNGLAAGFVATLFVVMIRTFREKR